MPAPDPQFWKTLKSEVVLDTPWMKVRRDSCELADGSRIDDYYVTERSDVVGIVAVTSQSELVMNRQYKHGIGKVVKEIPAGMVDNGETAEAAARRELEEETGYVAGELVHLATMVASPTTQTNFYHVYYAQDVQPAGMKEQNPREQIVNELIPVRQLEQEIADGTINVMWTIAAVYYALPYINKQQPS